MPIAFHHLFPSTMMKMKAVFCCVLFALVSLSAAKHVKLKVRGVTSIANTDENFICATIDWWPSDKCDYNQCPWGQSGILNLDLSNKILANALKAFNPMRIRIGGSLEDQVVYQFGNVTECPPFNKTKDGLFGFSEGCLPKNRWDQINELFKKTGVKFTFSLNALNGKKKTNNGILWAGNWNSNNARSLMEYTVSKGYEIDSYELGNELSAEGVSVRLDGVDYAKDITELRNIVNELYPNENKRPKILGPAGFYGEEWFRSFLEHTQPGVVDGVTHHIYNLGAGVDKDLINKVQDPYFLSKVAQTFKDVSTSVKEFAPWAGAWVGESGGAYNSGGKDVSHTFANGFWYLDQLGMTSTFNHKVYCRQALIGGNYALLNTTSFIPNPDYYGALLWHRLMGTKVLSVSHNSSPYLRAYAHCSKKGHGVSLLLINLSNSTSFHVSVANDMNLYTEEISDSGEVSDSEVQRREEYHLTPKDGDIQSDVVLLNGTPLKLTKSLDIPELKPMVVDDTTCPIRVAADSFVFVDLKNFKAPACA